MQQRTLFSSAGWLVLLLVIVLAQPAAADTVSTWQASSGLLPDQISPPWTLTNTASTDAPNLGGGVLTISTDTANELMLYQQTSPLIDTGSPFYIETRMRVASGFTSADSRAPALIAMTTGSSVGNTLFFGLNEIFFNTGNSTKGPSFAIHTSEFHTYRIEFRRRKHPPPFDRRHRTSDRQHLQRPGIQRDAAAASLG